MSVAPSLTEPFASLAALRTAHAELLKRHRASGETLELLAEVEQFFVRSRATGAILAEEDERWTAQSLLDYWNTTLYRAGAPTRSQALAEFDPLLAPELPEHACPYLGLDAFDEAKSGLFFGRRRVVAELVERLRDHRLIAVVGPSGSGKSSLVRAGLLPALRNAGVPGSADWQFLPPMVPGSDPGAALDRTMGAVAESKIQRPNPGIAGTDGIDSSDIDLLEMLLTAANGTSTPLLLIIDQFEEAFTLCTGAARRAEFLARVVALATDTDSPHRVVLTMRSDFEPFIARATTLQPLYEVGKVAIPPLTAGELREAIERPADLVGLKFEAGVVDSLLGDILGEPAALPLLQYSLLKLWEARERNRVTLAAYKQVGGGRLALARGADAAYAALIPEEQLTARRILLRLVRPGEGLEITSNRVRRADLNRGGEDPGRVARVLERLIRARLLRLTPGDSRDDAQVEVAHEALVRNWPTLVVWLEDERVALRQRQRLSAAAEQWQRLGRDPGALLQGRLLEEARAYDDLSELEQKFVQASVKAEEAQIRRAARTSLLIRALLVITTIASVATTLLAVQAIAGRVQADQDRRDAVEAKATSEANRQIADQQRAAAVTAESIAETSRAETERQREALTMAFQSQGQTYDSPELAMLLAYEGVKRNSDAITQQSLRDALAESVWTPVVLAGHSESVNAMAVSPDGQLIVTGSSDNTACLWDSSGHQVAQLIGHTGRINSVAFSPDGTRIVTASSDNTARIWDSSGGQVAQLIGHTGRINSVAFSPDGTRIVTASDDNTARLWSLADQSSQIVAQHTNPIVRAVFSPDGTYLLTGSRDQTAHLWDLAGNTVAIFGPHNESVLDVAFSPDGQHIATASQDGNIRLWDRSEQSQWNTGPPRAILRGHAGSVNSVQFSPDGQRILTSSDDATARLWDLQGNELVTFSGHMREVVSARFSPDGSRVLTASIDNTARLWNLRGQQLSAFDGHTLGVTGAIFSPNGKHILTASSDHTVRLWSLNGQEIGALGEHRLGLLDVDINAQGDRILTASWDGTAKLWGPNGEELTQFGGSSNGGMFGARFAPLSGQVLTFSDDGIARLWNDAGQIIQEFKGHEAGVVDAAFSPDGQKLVTASFDGTARLWSVSGQQLALLQSHSIVVSVVFSADGQHILTVSVDGITRVWSLAGDELLDLKNPDNGEAVSAVFSPDSTLILTSSKGGNAYLWDRSGQLIATLGGHLGSVNAVFSPDGQMILTTSWDHTARLWDLQGHQLATLTGHSGVIVKGVFSPDGKTILTASWDHTARLWSLSGKPLAIFRGHRDRVVRAIFSRDGQRVLTASWDGTARQYLVDIGRSINAAACRMNRGLTQEEIARFQVPTPLAFDFAKRQCPPVYSWEIGQ